jgi:hypothetical protein
MAEQAEIIVSRGGTMYSGRKAVNVARMITLYHGLKMEIAGLRMSRGRTCYAIIKGEFGLKGNKQRVLDQFKPLMEQAQLSVPVRRDGV